ncbi:toll/interleukin-1 receptor domain-containing protein [Isoptericola sp. NPDC057191]|uniref:toll/interleukin-1 receptor domain-containing protein n=1 Tax=Isoptericola sp. NPDC057191 TaxID=3346041 RepID=UPI00362A115C
MGPDLFISYAWTTDKHCEWVHLLAAGLKHLGFDVLLDADLDYGNDLNGFMRRVADVRHVLLVVDENYIERADNMPSSGVGKETAWISEIFDDREPGWLSAVYVDNPGCKLPSWLDGKMLKGFDFNYRPQSEQRFPGAAQIEDLWRWIADLPANRDHATPLATLRERATRLEQHALRSEPSQWRSPDLSGEVRFSYMHAPGYTYTWGVGDSEFGLRVSQHSGKSVYVYKDPIGAVGLIGGRVPADADLDQVLTPGRTVTPSVGQAVVLMNADGRLAVVEILDVQREVNGETYIAPHVTFRWRVVESS